MTLDESAKQQHRCGCCNRPITLRDISLYQAEGGPEGEIPACCEDCAEMETCSKKKCSIHG